MMCVFVIQTLESQVLFRCRVVGLQALTGILYTLRIYMRICALLGTTTDNQFCAYPLL